jgi:SAM-dependent MidA family methyltransferase
MQRRSLEDALPLPGDDALARSRALAALIHREIAASGGWIGFERYVELALYTPGLGYYSGGSEKFGRTGDFVTAPELSNVLARALAAALAPWLRTHTPPTILELGAGNGTLALQVLEALAALGLGDVRYRILEPSAELGRRQRERLAPFPRQFEWLERLPEEPFNGVILANEVVDALPFTCFVKRHGVAVPVGVRSAGERFEWVEGPPQPALERAVAGLEERLDAPLADGYRSEIRLVLPAWLDALAGTLVRGAVLLVDYGYTRRDYYRPERGQGTLMCHYRHRAHGDPFLYPGLQDITAWVDFSACADAGLAAGLDVAGYTTQAQLLLGALGEGLVSERERSSLAAMGALKTLLLPGEMGERFNALLLTKGGGALSLPGRDFRGWL